MAQPAKNRGGKAKPVKKVTSKVTTKAQTSVQGFVDFIRTQGVVGLAIGLIIGLQAKALVDQFTASFINPIVGLVLGGRSLADQKIYIQINSRGADFLWGEFAMVLINFIIIAAVIYITFKWLRLDKLDKKKS